ncbi:MAG: carbon storage regulator CsrA [Desulfotomaculum sp.]|nr:carbon storage regulator CsrA [Desulfotomaculum sp.]
MLVLSRKKGESINIGNDIKIVVVGIEGDRVRIGIEAPQQVDIYRTEIYTAIQEENLNSVAGSDVYKIVGEIAVKKDKKKS